MATTVKDITSALISKNTLEHITISGTYTVNSNGYCTDMTLVVTPDTGYCFDLENSAYISLGVRLSSTFAIKTVNHACSDSSSFSKTITFKSEYGSLAYITDLYDTGKIEIGGTPLIESKVTPTVPTVVNNIANCTVTYAEDGLDGWLFTAKASDGFVFDGTVKVTYRDSTGGGVTKALTVNNDSAYVDVADDFDLNYAFTFEGATKEKTTPTVTVQNNIENTTYTAEYKDSTGVLTVNVQASDSDGIFVVKPTITYTDSLGSVVTADMVIDLTTEGAASSVIDDIDITGTVILNGVCGRYVTVKTNLTNVTIKDEKTYYSADSSTTITINASDNTKLQEAQCYVYYTPTGGALETKYFELDDTGTTGTLTFVTPTSGTEINIVASASADISFLDNYGTINAYICSNDNIKSFAAKRFYTDTTSTTAKDIDLGNYVHSVQRYYFDISTSAQDTIRCGNVNTGVVCRAPESDTVTIDFGTVTVPLLNNNVVDYNNSEIRLLVPCVGFIDIDNNYINTPLHLYFVCNIITGTANYFVESNNILIATGSVTPYTNMVFMLSNSNNNIIGNSIQSNDTAGLQAYITVVTHTSTNSAYSSTQRAVTLSDCTGLCKFTDLQLDGISCTETEQTELLQLLQNGVIL